MVKTTVEDAIKTMTVLKQTGLAGPLMMDLSHPIFRMAMLWGMDGISHSSGEFSAPPRLLGSKVLHVEHGSPRSTTAITNQHGAILVDSYVDVSIVIAPDHGITRGTITRHNLVCGNNVFRSYAKTDEFALTHGDDVSGVTMSSLTEKPGTFKFGDTAFARFTRTSVKMAATSPVRITRHLGTKDSDPMVTVRLRPSSEPFFYALSRAEATRLDNAVEKRSVRTINSMFKAAIAETELAHCAIPLFAVTGGQLVPEASGVRVDPEVRFAGPPKAGIDFDHMHVPLAEHEKGAFSLFEIVMNFLHLGVKTMTPEQIVDLDNESSMVPIMFSEGI